MSDTEETFTLPRNYPQTPANRNMLKEHRPEPKSSVYEKLIQPYLSDLKKIVTDTINMKLEMAAQVYYSGDTSDEDYEKSKDTIYENVSTDQNWVNGIDDAFAAYSIGNDAYNLMVHVAMEYPTDYMTIESLFQHVSKEQESLATGKPLPIPSMTEVFDQKLEHLKKQPPQEKPADTAIRTFKQIIFVSVYPDRPMPFSLESGNAADDDDDVELDGGKVDLTCPISRKLFNKPVKSVICSHTYDLEGLKTYLRNSHICPECGSHLQMGDVQPDVIMQTRVDCFKRDQKLDELIKSRRPDETDKL